MQNVTDLDELRSITRHDVVGEIRKRSDVYKRETFTH